MYQCPHCAKPLNTRHVLSAGPSNARSCPSCNGAYFGGGMPMAMVALCTALALAALVFALTRSLLLAGLDVALGIGIGIWIAVHSPPKPAGRPWLEAFKCAVPLIALWAFFQVAPPLARSLASWLRGG